MVIASTAHMMILSTNDINTSSVFVESQEQRIESFATETI